MVQPTDAPSTTRRADYERVQKAILALVGETASYSNGSWTHEMYGVDYHEFDHDIAEIVELLIDWLDLNCPDGVP